MATFACEYAKSGRSSCKGTKELIPKGALRLAKATEREHGDQTISMSAWYLPIPFFQMMKRMRKGSQIVEGPADLAGFGELTPEDQQLVEKYLTDYHDEEIAYRHSLRHRRPWDFSRLRSSRSCRRGLACCGFEIPRLHPRTCPVYPYSRRDRRSPVPCWISDWTVMTDSLFSCSKTY